MFDFNDGINECDLDNESRRALKKQIIKKKIEAESKLDKIYRNSDQIELYRDSTGTMNPVFPCPEENCATITRNFKEHLMCNKHRWSEEDAVLQRSYMRRFFSYYTLMDKSFISEPVLCFECFLFVDRIDKHLKTANLKTHTQKTAEERTQWGRKYKAESKKFLQEVTYPFSAFNWVKKLKEKKIGAEKKNEHNATEKSKQASTQQRSKVSHTITKPSMHSSSTKITLNSNMSEASASILPPTPENQKISINNKKKVIGKQINLSPSKKSKYRVIEFAKALTTEQKRSFKILNENFAYYYDNGEDALNDFQNWCQITHHVNNSQAVQYANTVQNIWKNSDADLKTKPNKLKEIHDIDDFWFEPQLRKIQDEEKKPLNQRSQHNSAPTLDAKLGNLLLFLKFLGARQLFCGL